MDPFTMQTEARKLEDGKGNPEALRRVDRLTHLIGELIGPIGELIRPDVPVDHRRRVAAQIVTAENAAIMAWYTPQIYQELLSPTNDAGCIEYAPTRVDFERLGTIRYAVTRERLLAAMMSRFEPGAGGARILVEAYSRHLNHAALLGTPESEEYYAGPGLYNHPEVTVSRPHGGRPWAERDAFAVARNIIAEYRAFPRELRPTSAAFPLSLAVHGEMLMRVCKRLKIRGIYDFNLEAKADGGQMEERRAVFVCARAECVKFRIYPLTFHDPMIVRDAIEFPALYGWIDTELLDPRAVRYVEGV